MDAQVTLVLMGVGMSRDMWGTLEVRTAQGGAMWCKNKGTPGRDSEGCIRLRNADLNKLRKFAHVGTKVIIKPENAGKLPYELEAQSKLGSRYQPAHEGYKLPDDAMWTH